VLLLDIPQGFQVAMRGGIRRFFRECFEGLFISCGTFLDRLDLLTEFRNLVVRAEH
jgi:hypothetical protein